MKNAGEFAKDWGEKRQFELFIGEETFPYFYSCSFGNFKTARLLIFNTTLSRIFFSFYFILNERFKQDKGSARQNCSFTSKSNRPSSISLDLLAARKGRLIISSGGKIWTQDKAYLCSASKPPSLLLNQEAPSLPVTERPALQEKSCMKSKEDASDGEAMRY